MSVIITAKIDCTRSSSSSNFAILIKLVCFKNCDRYSPEDGLLIPKYLAIRNVKKFKTCKCTWQKYVYRCRALCLLLKANDVYFPTSDATKT